MYYLHHKHFLIAILSLCIVTPATSRMGFTIPQLISHPRLSLSSLERVPVRSVRIRLNIFGDFVTLELRPNQDLLHSNYAFQHLDSANQILSQSGAPLPCHFTGRVSCRGCHSSLVAVSTCGGELSGLISFNHTDYFVEPLVASDNDTHFVYTQVEQDTISTPSDVLFDKSDWLADVAREQASHIRRKARAYSIKNRRYYAEGLVVLDETVVRHYGTRSEIYALTVMNIVAKLLQRESIGQSVTLVVSRLVVLQSGAEGFKWNVDSPDLSLADFCSWQLRANGTRGQATHDFAVLLTRRSLCRPGSQCYVIGIANLAGMCSGAHSCLVVRDHGVVLSGTTVTHEIGHLLGMHHDETGVCKPLKIPPSSHIMTRVFTASSNHFGWSECSRRSFADFLSRGGDRCLLNAPTNRIKLPTDPLSADEQCSSIFGPGSSAVPSQTTCATVDCLLDTSNRSFRISVPLQDGANCSINSDTSGRCQSGVCVRREDLVPPIHGQWSQWDTWSSCSHSCDTGVRHRARECGHPAPSHGGDTCLGDRKQYLACKEAACATSEPSRRTLECREVLAHHPGTWRALSDSYRVSDPCQLICLQTEKRLLAGGGHVSDGTECHGMSSREALCVLGRCVRLDCEGKIGGAARRDACGVCLGNGSSCLIVSEGFDEMIASNGLHQLFSIPPLARGVSLLHRFPAHDLYPVVAQDGTSFKMRREKSINNDTWFFQRLSNGSHLISTSGPLRARTEIKVSGGPAWVALFLSYKVFPPKETDPAVPEEGHWLQVCSTCNATCGSASQLCHSVCVASSGETLPERMCEAHTKPANTSQRCENLPECPTFFWTTSPWTSCSARCGVGRKSRRTLCFARTHLSYKVMAESDCGTATKPATSLPCQRPCGTPTHATQSHTSATQVPVESNAGHIGVWSVKCNCKTKREVIECRISGAKVAESNCDINSRPTSQAGNCRTRCRPVWRTGKWQTCNPENCRISREVECWKNGAIVAPGVCHRANKKRPTHSRKCTSCP